MASTSPPRRSRPPRGTRRPRGSGSASGSTTGRPPTSPWPSSTTWWSASARRTRSAASVPTAEHVRRYLRPNGLALIGEGFWEREPTPEALTRLGAEPSDFLDLPGTVAAAESAGFDTIYAYTSDLSEWDDYEWSWTGTLLRWANENPGPDADAARAAALEHRDMWLHGYRRILGFVTLLLQRTG